MCFSRVSINFAVTFNELNLCGGCHIVNIKLALLATLSRGTINAVTVLSRH